MRAILLLTIALVVPVAATAQDDFRIHVQYPPEGEAISASDSTFLFGRIEGAAAAETELTVNGIDVVIHSGGGWLAWVPVEPDSFTFRVRAVSGGAEAFVDHTVWVPHPLGEPGDPQLRYKPETIEPIGRVEMYPGDTVRVSVVAAPGQTVGARVGSRVARLRPEPVHEANRGRQIFGEARESDRGRSGAQAWVRYRGDVVLRDGLDEGRSGDPDTLLLEFTRPGEAPAVVPVSAVDILDAAPARVAFVSDDTVGTGRTDHRVIARSGPRAGYYLFLPNDTPVTLGRKIGNQQEIVLGPGTSAWVAEPEVHRVDLPAPRSRPIAAIRARLTEGWSEIVVPTTARLPFVVTQAQDPVRYTVTIFGVGADTDWVRYATEDPLLEEVRWREPATRVFELEIDLAADQAWGFRSYWEGSHLVVGFRHPPPAMRDRRFRSRLHGVRVVVDAGHHPAPGAVGPTGLEERDANFEIALELARILEHRGADVVLTRATRETALGLYERTNLALAQGGEVFVSIHNNALPDGVNPFVNNGTSTYYYYPQSRPLAEAIQRELLPRTGLNDYGVSHGNLAVLRMNEMPSVLVEGAFMMIPEQEASLRTEAFRRQIAEGVAAGIERFLEERDL